MNSETAAACSFRVKSRRLHLHLTIDLTPLCGAHPQEMVTLIARGGDESVGVRSFPVRNILAEEAMVMHVIPIRLSARDIFVRSAAALVLTPVTLPQAPPVELVQSLFDLTPTEARVARSLASGKTVEDIAADSGVSANTVRTHVRGVLEKTGRNRQAEVVALLTGIFLTRPV